MGIPYLPQVSGTEPQYFQMTVTPAMALCWLAYNHNNRPPSKNRIETYRRYMKSGEWNAYSSHLSFSQRGLIDGQHRLMALVGLDEGYEMQTGIFVNMPEHAALYMDTNFARSLAHRTGIDKDRIALAQWMDKVSMGGARILSPSEARGYYERHRKGVDWVLEHNGKKGFCRTQYRLAMVWLFERNEEAARDFFEVFHGLSGAETTHPAMALRNKVITWLVGAQPPIYDIYSYAMTAVKARLEDRPLTYIKRTALGAQKW